MQLPKDTSFTDLERSYWFPKLIKHQKN